MNIKWLLSLATCLLIICADARAQGTAFTYQGRLQDGGASANGRYDLEFSLFDGASAGTRVAGPVTNAAILVNNGIFTVILDFGSASFNGSARWLQIGVRTNGSVSAFAGLVPRQQITPAPYAVLAGNLNGVLPDSQLSANIPRLNANQTFSGAVTFSGAPASVNFGSNTRQMINLFGTAYGVGVQNSTLYMRSDEGFAWFRDGVHATTANDPGPGGTNLMLLDFSGHLQVNAGVTVDNAGANTGTYYPGVLFGPGSGESISSQRATNGNNRYGIDFYTAFARRMSIANNGNVGIGIGTPVHRLDVNGNAAVRGSLLLNHDSTQDATYPELPGIIFGDINSGEVISSQRGTNGVNRYGFDFYTAFARRMRIRNDGRVDVITGVGDIQFRNDSGLVPGINLSGGGIPGILRLRNALEIWPDDTRTRQGQLDVRDTSGNANIVLRGSGTATVKVLEITGGADVAEPFQMNGDAIPKGAVVVIDEENPGRLKMSSQPYDTRVAGIISGANGISPGIALHQQGALEGGQNVALSGRVYALADASQSAIKPGDLLTTSSAPGHAMKANDTTKTPGAVLGKAMSSLKDGKGYVLVLVSLQ